MIPTQEQINRLGTDRRGRRALKKYLKKAERIHAEATRDPKALGAEDREECAELIRRINHKLEGGGKA